MGCSATISCDLVSVVIVRLNCIVVNHCLVVDQHDVFRTSQVSQTRTKQTKPTSDGSPLVAIGTMKILDLWARRNSLPTYAKPSETPADWHLSLLLLTELRYESFTPNHVRVSKDQESFSEPLQLGIHIAIFSLLQTLPQIFPTVLAFEVLLSIYILWTSMQLVLRYKSSPALFGPLYLADSLSGFW